MVLFTLKQWSTHANNFFCHRQHWDCHFVNIGCNQLPKFQQLYDDLSISIYDWNRADSWFAPSQWEMLLQSNAVSHWLGANLESALWNLMGIDIQGFLYWIRALGLSNKPLNGQDRNLGHGKVMVLVSKVTPRGTNRHRTRQDELSMSSGPEQETTPMGATDITWLKLLIETVA